MRFAAATTATLLLAACSPTAQDQAETDANATAADVGATTRNAVNDVDAATDRALDRAGNAIDRGADKAGRAANAAANEMGR